MKIALISPFPPYRGGISKYSKILYDTLSENYDVFVYNFMRLYPEVFFPGKNQYETNDIIYNDENIIRIIDSIHPLSWLNTADHIVKNKFDIVIIRYWNPFFIPCYKTIVRRIKKNNDNIKVFSICDNIIAHENYFLQKFLIKSYLKKIDGTIVMSQNVENELLALNLNIKYTKLFLPIISDIGQKIDYSKAKKILDLDLNKVTFLFFGLIRKYKGLDVLISSINLINDIYKDKFECLIVGEPYININKFKNKLNSKFNSNVKWINNYISEENIKTYFSASDYSVLPYKTASQSAIVPLSFNFNVPVIVSDVLGLTEHVEKKNTGYIFKKNDSKDLSRIMEDCIVNQNRRNNLQSNIIAYKKQLSSKNFVSNLISFIS